MRPRLVLALQLLAAGANPAATASPAKPPGPPAELRFAVEPRVAAPGAPVTLLLVNRTAAEVGYNLCMSGLERLDRGGWRSVRQQGACTRELRIAAPGQTARYRRTLPSGLGDGFYRFRTRVEAPLMGPQRQQPIVSETFRVRR